MSLNLAKKPFVNKRPVRRMSILAWTLGLVLALVNGYLYWDYLSGQGATETGMTETLEQIEEESELLARAQEQLAGLEAEELNSKIEFVNLRIQQRTFSWSRLFDVLAETLPADVRLASLTPKFETTSRRRRSRVKSFSPESIQLSVQGQAKSSQALLEFLDRLFAHPAFEEPDLHQEQARADQDVIDYSISTLYLPDAVEAVSSASAQPEEKTE